MAAVELATAYVTLAVDSSKIGKEIGKGFAGGDRVASRSGRSMGLSMAKAFSASKPLKVDAAAKKLKDAQDDLALHTERSAAKQRKAQENVAAARQKVADVATKSSEKVSSAQEKVEDAEANLARTVEQSSRDQESAKRKVELAQAQYNETVSKYGAESTQALGAANRLADAEDRLTKTTTDGAAKQEAAKRKVTEAQEKYAEAVKDSGEDSDAARKAADELSVAEQKLEAAALDAASGHDKLAAEVAGAKSALDEAERSSTGLRGAWSKVKDFGADYKGMGDRLNKAIGPKIWTGIKWGALGVAGAIGGALLGSLKKGWDRLSGIENAESKLSGLGHSAEDVSLIMDDALAAVKGTAFGMDEAATSAASAVAAGIEPGKDLEKYLSLVGDAATIAGSDLGEMGSIFGKVAANGKLSGDVLNQMTERGIGLLPKLAEHYGVTNEEAQKMVSAGKVSFEDFADVMEDSLGGAALKAGGTTQGAFKNMGAAMGRFGAALLKDVYPLIGPLFGKVTDLFDYLTDAAGPAIEGVVTGLKEWASTPGVQSFVEGLRDAAVALYENALKPLGEWIGKHWKPIAAALGGLVAYLGGSMLVAAIAAIGAAIGGLSIPFTAIGAAIAAVIGGLAYFFSQTETGQKIIKKVFAGIKSAVAGVADFFTTKVWPALLSGWDVLKRVVAAVWSGAIKPIFTAVGKLAMQVWGGVVIPAFEQLVGYMQGTVMPIVQKLWTDYVRPAFKAIGALAVWLWNNAIKPAVTLIAGFFSKVLGPVIVWVWKKVFLPAFKAIGDIVAWAVTGVIFPLLDGLKVLFTKVIGPAATWLWKKAIVPAWDGISSAVKATVDWMTKTAWPGIKSVWDAIAGAAKWLNEKVIQPAWTGIKIAIAVAVTAVLTYIDLLKWYFEKVIAPVALWLYTKVIKPAWEGIKAAIGAVVTWFKDTAWPLLKKAWDAVAAAANWLWKKALKPAWDGIRSAIDAVVVWFRDIAWGKILSPAIEAIKTGFNAMRDGVKKAWDSVKTKAIKPVVDWFTDTVKPKIDTFTDNVKTAFTTMKDSVLKAWEKVKDGLKSPINGVINIYNKHIKDNFDKVADGLGLDTRLPKMNAFYTGGYTGPGAKYKEAGIVHADEYVIRKESQNDLSRKAPGLLDALNRHGSRALGYAGGGLVKLRMPFNGSYPRGEGFGARGGRHKGIDYPMPHGTVLKAVAPGRADRTWNPSAGNKLELKLGNGLIAGYHHLSSFIAGRGAQVPAGADVARVGSTGRSSGPHLHFSLKRDGKYVDPAPYLGGGGSAGSGDSGGWNPFEGMWSEIKGSVSKAVGGGMIGDVLTKVASNTVGWAKDWVSDKLFGSWDRLLETGGATVGALKASRWLPVAQHALEMTGYGTQANLTALMRRMEQESGYNPRAINNWDSNAKRGTPSKGLMQVIQPTFDRFRDSRAPNDIWDPLANILASIHYTAGTYGSLTRGWNRKGGYADGGLVKPFLHDSGGWHDPGQLSLNLTRKPEAVLTDSQWATMTRAAERGVSVGSSDDIERLARLIAEEVRSGSREGVADGLSGGAARARSRARMGAV